MTTVTEVPAKATTPGPQPSPKPSPKPAPKPAPLAAPRRQVPSVLQLEATECGAASLGMVLASYGRFVPLEELRVLCGVSRDGSKASTLLRAARGFGLEAAGFRLEPEDLPQHGFPQIVHMNFNHFMVLEGIDARRDRVFLNDPAGGPRMMDLKEFSGSFTGVTLTFKRGPDFAPGGRKPSLRGRFAPLLGSSRGALLFVGLIALALIVPGIVLPAFSRVFIDEVLMAHRDTWLMPLLIGLFLAALSRWGLSWAQQAMLARLEMRLAIAYSARFVWHLLRLPSSFYAQRHPGDLVSRVTANDRVATALSGPLAAAAVGFIQIAFFMAVMLTYDLVLALIVAAFASINVVVLKVLDAPRELAAKRQVREASMLAAVAASGLQQLESLKASGAEDQYFARYAGSHVRTLAAVQEGGRLTVTLTWVPEALAGLTVAGVTAYGGFLIMQGALTVGGLVAFLQLTGSLLEPIRHIVTFGASVQVVKADLARIYDVQDQPLLPGLVADDAPGDAEPDALAPAAGLAHERLRLTGRVEASAVSFGYNLSEKPLIQDLSFSIAPGQWLALVGGSGSGKSTVAKLVAGLYEPWEGEIRFDGIPRPEVPRRRIFASVATVDQEIFLFEGTLRENLTMWDPTVPTPLLTRALADVGLLDVVATRPGRLDCAVSEGGTNFSGGQRQRLEIARALVGEPSLLVLDEATAALDPVAELLVMKALRRRGCACLVVAHRLSTVRDCDEIIVLAGGKAVERGTHAGLLATDGPYARLVRGH